MKTSRSTIILTGDSGSRDGKTVVIGLSVGIEVGAVVVGEGEVVVVRGSSVGIEVGAVVVGEGEVVVVNRSGLDISREEAVEGDSKEGIMVVRSREGVEVVVERGVAVVVVNTTCLLYTSPSPRDLSTSRMPSSA